MTFLIILIALLIERFFDWSHLRHWHLYIRGERALMERLPGKSPYLILALTVIPLLILVGVLIALFDGWLYGFITLLFDLFILLYCLGPKNLWADTFACMNALAQSDSAFAMEKVQQAFSITPNAEPTQLHQQLLDQIFIQANRRVFAVIFWYAVLGPLGAVLYRAIAESSDTNYSSPGFVTLKQSAQVITGILDWLPVRIFTFLFALGGHFVQVIACWHRKIASSFSNNDALLTYCGRAALGAENASQNEALEKSAVSLLDRVFIIFLVIMLILVLIA